MIKNVALTLIGCLIFSPEIANSAAPLPVCAGLKNMIYQLDQGPVHIHERVSRDDGALRLLGMSGWECGADPPEVEREGRVFLSGIACWHQVTAGSDDDNYTFAGQTFIRYLKSVNDCFRGSVLNETPSMIKAPGVQYENMLILLSNSAQNRRVLMELSYGRGQINGPFYWSVKMKYTAITVN